MSERVEQVLAQKGALEHEAHHDVARAELPDGMRAVGVEQQHLVLLQSEGAAVDRLRARAGVYIAYLDVAMDMLRHGIETRVAPEGNAPRQRWGFRYDERPIVLGRCGRRLVRHHVHRPAFERRLPMSRLPVKRLTPLVTSLTRRQRRQSAVELSDLHGRPSRAVLRTPIAPCPVHLGECGDMVSVFSMNPILAHCPARHTIVSRCDCRACSRPRTVRTVGNAMGPAHQKGAPCPPAQKPL